MTLATPFPEDPLDPATNSKNSIFIKRIVTFDSRGHSRLMFFDFSSTPPTRNPYFWTQILKIPPVVTKSHPGDPMGPNGPYLGPLYISKLPINRPSGRYIIDFRDLWL